MLNNEATVDQKMVSFLTHSLTNMLGTAPEAARQAIRLLSSEDYEKNIAHYQAINNISSVLTTFSVVDNLIQTFKQYTTSPDIFQLSWHQDNQGNGSIEFVIVFALRQTISRIFFQSAATHVKELLPSATELNLKKLRHSFIDEIIGLDLTPDNAQLILAWLKQHFDIFVFDLDAAKDIHFADKGTRFTSLFSIFSELIYNALKYGNGNAPIQLVWGLETDTYYLTCSNRFNPDLRYRKQGSGKGLEFIEGIMKQLENSKCSYREQGDTFTVKLSFAKTLFEENSHENHLD